MLVARTGARYITTTTRTLRTAAVALLATAAVAAPIATFTTVASASSAQAGGWTGPVIDLSQNRTWLSPNGDGTQEKARLTFALDKPARVTVKVRRDDKARTLVLQEELGKLDAGVRHEWTWKGRNADRRVVRDGHYSAIFVADQVGRDGKKRTRTAELYVDTKFDAVKAPTLSIDTLYPRTTLIRDALVVTLPGKGHLASVGRAVMKVTDAQGHVVRRSSGAYDYWPKFQSLFDGRDAAGTPLPGGQYSIGFKVWDKAGNTGRSERVPVTVSDKALVERTGTLVVPPAGSWKASGLPAGTASAAKRADDPSSTTGGDDPQPAPCGKVVPSEVYANAGAMSYRSAETCPEDYLSPRMAWASGYLALDNLTFEVAPRGLYSGQVSMRGRPTVAGETDTAVLYGGGLGFDQSGAPTSRGTASPAVAHETVTSTERVTAAQPSYYSRPTNAPSVYWTIATRGVDSFDVADVTVQYSYLTPQP